MGDPSFRIPLVSAMFVFGYVYVDLKQWPKTAKSVPLSKSMRCPGEESQCTVLRDIIYSVANVLSFRM